MKTILSYSFLFITVVTYSQSNLQNYTPSILFDKGEWEYKTFQNLYTQTKQFNSSGSKVDKGFRETFFTSINQFLYGVNSQVNVGMDVWVKASNSSQDAFDTSAGLTGLGPKIKVAPFKDVPRLSIQSTYLFNLSDDPEGMDGDRYFLEWDGDLWLNQIFFDWQLNDKSQLFFQQAFWYRLVAGTSSVENNFLETQTSIFYSYFPNARWTVYGMSEYFPRHYDLNAQQGEAFFSYFVQSGVGLKYQLVPNLIELEALYTNFWNGSEGQGAGETINLGIRVIRQ